jgi:hypothetical protein
MVPDAAFNEEVFLQLYSKQEQYLYSDTTHWVSITPLVNFESDINRADLETGLAIRKISDTEREIMSADHFDRFGLELFQSKYTIEQAYEVPKSDQQAILRTVNLSNQVVNLVTALRLFKPGVVGTKFTSTYETTWTPKGGVTKIFPNFQAYYGGKVFGLQSSEVESFRKFYHEFKFIENDPDVAIAVRRFRFYYDRPREEDRLIDSMVAFENLLLPEKLELSLRLATRAANLLGKTPEEKRRVFSLFREAYDVRSSIVHGDTYDTPIRISEKETLSLADLVEQIEGYLRITIIELFRIWTKESKKATMKRLENPF